MTFSSVECSNVDNEAIFDSVGLPETAVVEEDELETEPAGGSIPVLSAVADELPELPWLLDAVLVLGESLSTIVLSLRIFRSLKPIMDGSVGEIATETTSSLTLYSESPCLVNDIQCPLPDNPSWQAKLTGS